ncbi:hypothetical protein [Nocardia terpenica]|uniref:Uncharacterized protein n=1 Tax=Nocardia terpenica TaxID=455432 RepID=A0A291RCP1_9NOCA|nr:hypothetical protein [Nocardia terpenica]ATL65090.1 hypothetical protein CRH09_01455 [Nocardia terpenica]
MNSYRFGCDCQAVLIRRGKPWDGQADHRRLNDMWSASTHRKSGKAALTAVAHHARHRPLT